MNTTQTRIHTWKIINNQAKERLHEKIMVSGSNHTEEYRYIKALGVLERVSFILDILECGESYTEQKFIAELERYKNSVTR